MSQQKKYLASGLLILTILIVVFLASGISGMEFQSGIIKETERTQTNLVAPKLPDLLSPILYYIFLFTFWVIVPIAVVLFIKFPEFRKLFLKRLLYLCLYAFIFFLFIRKSRGEVPELEKIEDQLIDTTIRETQKGAVDFVAKVGQADQNFNLLINLVILVVIGVLIWYLYRRFFLKPASATDQLKAEVEEALSAIQAGVELRNVIIRCYADMSKTLNEQRGLQRKQAMTPREFENQLQEVGLPHTSVHRLTRLFEEARYGNAELGHEAEEEAIDCLTDIAAACS